ncbi:hypothetical protein VTH82DRAFT_2363 [Thermothelomyces myriococcoides]
MARRKRTGVAKTTDSTTMTTPAATTSNGADAKGLPQGKPAAVTKHADPRPENSPYGSPSCTVPFASPLTVPLEILKKCPKLYAAYELRLPELPAIPEAVGHVLVHYLHTGTYESLKPKPTETASKQITELKTSIQVYAAARTYELPELMRLAKTKIEKNGKGLPLPTLLEAARDSYPNLNEGDAWFLNYLRQRIRPHLKDPKSLMGSNLLDQISGILSPNKVLLRTVLELFCERIVVRPETATPTAANGVTSPVASPDGSRPESPQPPTSSLSLLEMRSRSVVREEYTPTRKSQRATPWQSPDNMSEASWSRSMSPDPALPEVAPPKFEICPVVDAKPAATPFLELGPVIHDAASPAGPSTESKVENDEAEAQPPASEPQAEGALEPEVETAEPEVEDAAQEAKSVEPEVAEASQPEIKAAEPEAEATPKPEVSIAIEPEPKAELEVELPAEPKTEPLNLAPAADVLPETAVKVPAEGPVETDAVTAVELEAEKPEESSEPVTSNIQRERKDSGKGIDLEPLPKELDSSPEHVSEPEPASKSQPHIRPQVFREADSGFWEGTEVESGKEPAPSVAELGEPVAESTPKVAHELESDIGPKDAAGVEIRDFANPDAAVESESDKPAETETAATKDAIKESQPEKEVSPEAAADVQPKELESQPAKEASFEVAADDQPKEPELQPEPEVLPAKSTEATPEQSAEAAAVVSEVAPAEEVPDKAKSKEVEAQPETEKVQKETVEPQDVAKSEPEPQAAPSEPVPLPDAAESAGPVEAKAAQPGVESEPEPSGKREGEDANADSVVHIAGSDSNAVEPTATLGAKPATEQENTKAEADGVGSQPCSAQVRQRSWKRRFLSLRYPVLFGRGT